MRIEEWFLIPILFKTAYPFEKILNVMLGLTFFDVIQKPYFSDDLLTPISAAIGPLVVCLRFCPDAVDNGLLENFFSYST
ncbi:MAG: hypothetical protein WCF90_06095 [Methanomicrobiales archaeon]